MKIKISDQSFELKVQQLCKSKIGFIWSNGSYVDYFTNKLREYDIRGKIDNIVFRTVSSDVCIQEVFLTIECKNISDKNSIVLLSNNQNQENFSLNAYKFFKSNSGYVPLSENLDIFKIRGLGNNSNVNHNYGEYHHVDIYKIDKENEFTRNSNNNRSEFYDKWSQTINSMVDLIKESHFEIENANVPEYRFAFFPITVVPDDKLYFGKIEEGKEFIDTQKGNICFYQLNAEIKNVVRGYPLSINNSIFCTFSGLEELLGVLVNTRAV